MPVANRGWRRGEGGPLMDDRSRPNRGSQRWEHLLLGPGVGLHLSRVLMESGVTPRSWPVVLSLGLACVALAIALLAWARQLQYSLHPLALCYGYALYPRPHPSLALAVGVVALLGLVISNHRPGGGAMECRGDVSRRERPRLSLRTHARHSLVFLGGLALYWSTLAPTVLPADAGEFQLVAPLLGVAHPPGYPLYTLLGKLFTFIPLGDLAYRVNLLSAVVGALTLALVSWAICLLAPSPWPGLAAALALAGATTFWAQATTASIRGVTALFTALILALALAYGHTRAQGRRSQYLMALGAAFGLGIPHHGSLGFLALPVAAYLISRDRALITHRGRLLKPLAAALFSLSVLLYLPLRDAMAAPLAPGDLTSLRGFLEHVTAQGFRGDMFAFVHPALLADRAAVLRDILLMQFGGPLLLAIVSAAGLLVWRGRPSDSLLIGGALLLNAFVALTYRAPQTVEYLMPAYVCLALLLGGGLGVTMPRSLSGVLALPTALTLYLGLAQALAHYPSFALLHHDRSARTYAEEILQAAPSQAVILANWHRTTSLRYLQMVEGQRPDVTIRYVHPRGSASPPDLWRAEIERHIQDRAERDRPVIVTNFYPEFDAGLYRFRPLGEAFLVAGPGEGLDAETHDYTSLSITVGDAVELLGYHLKERTIGPQQPLVLLLAWRPLLPPERDLSFFLHLVGTDGIPVAQADTRHAGGRYQTHEVLVDRYTLFLRPTVPPGSYTLIVGAYTPLADGGWERLVMPDGADHMALTRVEVLPRSQMPVTMHPCHQPFTGGITLVGVDSDSTHPHAARLYLHWHIGQGAPAAEALLFCGGQLCSSSLLPGSPARSIYLSTACDIAPEVYSLRIALRRASDGQPLLPLGPWYLAQSTEIALPPLQAGSRYLSLGGEVALVGSHITRGKQLSVGLDLVALRPLTRDYTLSVRLRDAEGKWQAQQDGTPGGGAIPTLKWIRGTRVTNVWRVSPPPGAELDQAWLELMVYDAFTLTPLPPLDERLLAQGPLIPLGEVKPSTAP